MRRLKIMQIRRPERKATRGKSYRISTGDVQIDGRLLFGFVVGMKHSQRGVPVFGVQAGLLAGGRVLTIEDL
jgi:hypothetical protein